MAIVIEVIHDSSPLHSICSNPTEIAMCAHNNIILINKLRPQTPPSSSLISADKAKLGDGLRRIVRAPYSEESIQAVKS